LLTLCRNSFLYAFNHWKSFAFSDLIFLYLFRHYVFWVINHTWKAIDSFLLDFHHLSCWLVDVSTACRCQDIHWTQWICWTHEVQRKKENEWLFFNASKYLIDLFWKISSDYFICSFHLRHECLQSSWLSLQFMHHLLFINTLHFLMWCLSVHLKQHSSFLQNLVIWSKSKHL